MKKMLVFFIIFAMLFSVALADSPDDFIARWNKAAHVYGAPELADYIKSDDTLIFKGDNWSVSLTYFFGFSFKRVDVFSSSPDVYLALCANTGVAALQQKTIDMLNQYDANILESYLKLVSGQEPYKALYLNTYRYQFEKAEDGFLFSMFAE